ncbi:MAG: glycosyltransferase family 4 protein, partial [Rhizomicrobium sp.]|nr:glycosyltransferase family 4 protein [Rhizomicrobium sp.]
SHWSKEGFIRFGFPESWVHVVPHGVDPALFYPLTQQERAQARSAIGFTDQHFVFLNIGALSSNKGVDILVRAFAVIRQNHRGAVLLLKDARALYALTADDSVDEIIRAHNLDPALRDAIAVIPDNLDLHQMREVYGLADAYVSPYRAEGFNLPPLEAAACGLPVLLSQGGATDDYAHPSFAIPITTRLSGNGIENWLEPELDSVVAGMEALIERRSGCDASKAVPWIAEHFSWAKAVDKLLNVFGG